MSTTCAIHLGLLVATHGIALAPVFLDALDSVWMVPVGFAGMVGALVSQHVGKHVGEQRAER